MIKLFRANSWNLHSLLGGWRTAVLRHAELFRIKDCPVLVGDGMKHPKEGRHMPGVKKLAQESETQSNPEMIFGHMWGGIGILIGKAGSIACLPLSLRIHDGLKESAYWEGGDPDAALSHTVRMILEGCIAARSFGRKCFLLLDRYFLTVPALKELAAQNLSDNACQVQLITRAKMGTVAFMPPAFRKPGQRGRTRKKGDKVKLAGLFESKSNEFCQTQAAIYDQVCTVRYYSTDLLWGQGLYKKIRFVLVSYGKTRCILRCPGNAPDTLAQNPEGGTPLPAHASQRTRFGGQRHGLPSETFICILGKGAMQPHTALYSGKAEPMGIRKFINSSPP